MNLFTYDRASESATALKLHAGKADAKYLGGGTNLVDLMRENIEHPAALIDVTSANRDITEGPDGSLVIGAGAKNTAVAESILVRERFPLLAEAILAGASGQIRNMATVGGNILQRTRCYYFYDTAARCNKREPGSGCDAIEGFNRIHAILGASQKCVATQPSDMCVALAALDATVQLSGPGGEREVKFVDLHRLPGDTPDVETNLTPGELIASVTLPALSFAKDATYRKVRDRASYAFAIVSVAVMVDIADDNVRDVRLALGGVAHKPWRATAAETFLKGKPSTEENFRAAADAELRTAAGLEHNAFKIDLVRRVIVRALTDLSKA